MKDKVRTGVAYIAGKLITNKDTNSIYDYTSGKYISMSGDISGSRVNVYDYGAQCHINGNGNSGKYSLYHYGVGKHINLNIDKAQKTFDGYDYDTGKHFNGRVDNSSISLYDYETGKYHSFSI